MIQAIKGNSALLTALRSLLRDEFYTLNGEEVVNIFLDIRKFYDHIDWRRLLLCGRVIIQLNDAFDDIENIGVIYIAKDI